MKKLISTLLVILMLVSPLTMGAYAGVGDHEFEESESNDYFDETNILYSDYTVYGYLDGEYDMDFFEFTLTEKSDVNFLCLADVDGVLVGLYDEDEELITAASSYYSEGYYYDSLYETLSPGTYYIVILGETGCYDVSYLYYFEYEGVGHTHKYSKKVTKPTCVAEGYTTYTCSCGDSYKSDYTSNGDHSESEWITDIAATCLAEGTQYKKCTLCGEITTTGQIPLAGHTYSEWEVLVAATCTAPGKQKRYCTVCAAVEEADIDSSTAHKYVETIEKATLDADGQIKSECQYCGNIVSEPISKISSVKLSSTSVTYNGKARKPSVTVKNASKKTLVEGKDYDVTYPGEMKLPGKYSIVVKFKGNYSGKKTLSFTIAPKATTGVKAETQTTTSVTLKWTKTTGATGYRVYQYNPSKGEYVVKASVKDVTTYKVTGLKAGTTYKFKIKPYVKSKDGTVIWGAASSALATATKPATPTLKATAASGNKVNLSWSNVSGESGYQVYYSTSKNGTYEKMKSLSTDTLKYTTSKLTAGKTYYFKVRAYVKVDGKVIYGAFSEIKAITIKKATTSSSSTSTTSKPSNNGVYYVTRTGSKYHVNGCRSLSQSKIQISYSSAIAKGYKPCSVCIG